jgi:hypothetical protein
MKLIITNLNIDLLEISHKGNNEVSITFINVLAAAQVSYSPILGCGYH